METSSNRPKSGILTPPAALLERSSAKHFLDYHAHLHRRAIALEDIVHRIAVINRGSWGELSFADSSH